MIETMTRKNRETTVPALNWEYKLLTTKKEGGRAAQCLSLPNFLTSVFPRKKAIKKAKNTTLKNRQIVKLI